MGPRLWPALALLLALAVVATARAGGATVVEGFGAAATGGAGGRIVPVTSLADAGPGSLRQALHGLRGGRVVFDVAGTIHLARPIAIRRQSFVTIDGATAPAPGITLRGHGIAIRDSHDVVLSHVRVREAAGDGVSIKGSARIVITRCSLSDAGDENLAVTEDTRDVTISWCILGHTPTGAGAEPPTKGMLIASFRRAAVTNVSVHHNLFVNESQRNPQVSTPGLVDVRNNVVWDWRAYGIRFRNGARGNIVNNVFRTSAAHDRAVVVDADAGPVCVRGNVGPDGRDVNEVGTAPECFAAAQVTTDPAAVVELRVVEGAGATPRDDVDRRFVTWRGPGAAARSVGPPAGRATQQP